MNSQCWVNWPPHHSLRLNFQISRTSGAWVDVVRQEIERLMPKASSKPVGGRDMDLIALYRGCLSTGCWRLERRLMCNRSVIPRSKNGSDAITCCSLYKIHPSTYGMFQADTGRQYVCMRSRNRVLYRCKRLCTAPTCLSRQRPCRVCLLGLQCLHLSHGFSVLVRNNNGPRRVPLHHPSKQLLTRRINHDLAAGRYACVKCSRLHQFS